MQTNHYESLDDDTLATTAIGFLSANQAIPDDLRAVIDARGFGHFFENEDWYYAEAAD